MSIGSRVVSQEEALEAIDAVLQDLDESVVSTMGPMGNTVIINDLFENVPHVTKDGVTVSESISYSDPLKATISNLIKEAARKTAAEVGDGTTTAILLTSALLNSVLKLKPAHTNFRSVLEGMEKAVDFIIEYLQEEVTHAEINSEELKSVIHTSSNSDSIITELLSSVTQDIGPHGIIDVKEADANETFVKIKSGAVIDSRVLAYPDMPEPFDHAGEAKVLLVEGDITRVSDIRGLLYDPVIAANQPLVIIAKGFDDEVIRVVSVNNQRKARQILLVEAEGFANSRLIILEDIAKVTGAEIYSTGGATKKLLTEFQPEGLGVCIGLLASQKELILAYDTAILSEESIKTLVEELSVQYKEIKGEELLSSTRSGYFSNLKRRLSKYVSIAEIHVGGKTKAEAAEIKDRIDDAVAAISASVNDGILPGGGSAFVRAVQILEARRDQFVNDEEWAGAQCVKNACLEPIYTLSRNSGVVFDEEILPKLLEDSKYSYDIINQEVVNAFDAGILDPALVAINSLNNALAVTKSIANSSSIIVKELWQDIEEELLSRR